MKRIIEWVNAILLFMIFAIISAEILFRGVLRIPIAWTDELSRSVYIVLVFLGASTALRDRSHITVDILTKVLPESAKRVLRIISSLLMFPFIVVMVLGAVENIPRFWTIAIATVRWLKMGYLYLVVVVSGVLMMFYIVLNTIDDIRNIKAKTEKTSEKI